MKSCISKSFPLPDSHKTIGCRKENIWGGTVEHQVSKKQSGVNNIVKVYYVHPSPACLTTALIMCHPLCPGRGGEGGDSQFQPIKTQERALLPLPTNYYVQSAIILLKKVDAVTQGTLGSPAQSQCLHFEMKRGCHVALEVSDQSVGISNKYQKIHF